MLKAELTENYAGFTIYGDFDDLNLLYDSINHLIVGETSNIGEYMMQGHLYGFLYDVRHAYQGDREAILISNFMSDNSRQWFGFKKKEITDKNVCYCFNYLLPDLILDMILIKHFISKVDKKDNNEYNPYVNMVNFFYSLVLHALGEFLTERRFNKVKKSLLEAHMYTNAFIPQWFEIISIDYAKMTKSQREKELMHIIDYICNYIDYEDYYAMKKRMEKICEEEKCTLDDIHYDDYPKEIDW